MPVLVEEVIEYPMFWLLEGFRPNVAVGCVIRIVLHSLYSIGQVAAIIKIMARRSSLDIPGESGQPFFRSSSIRAARRPDPSSHRNC
jgi:hypothetical protein